MPGNGKNGATPDVWEFDWNKVCRGEMKALTKTLNAIARQAVKETEDGGDTDIDMDEPLFPISAKVIVRWPYEYPPQDIASYDKLGMEAYTEWYNRFWATFPKRVVPAPTADGG